MDGIVEVEQSDREAAAKWYDALSRGGVYGPASQVAVRMQTGVADENWLVQAFAHHRIAEREACAKVALGVGQEWKGEDVCPSHIGHEAADAIRNRGRTE